MSEHLPFAVTIGTPQGKRIARFEAARCAQTFARERSNMLVGTMFCVVDTSVRGAGRVDRVRPNRRERTGMAQGGGRLQRLPQGARLARHVLETN